MILLFCALFIIAPVILIILRSSFGSAATDSCLGMSNHSSTVSLFSTTSTTKYEQNQNLLEICSKFAQICSCFVVVAKTVKE